MITVSNQLPVKRKAHQEDFWISLSDLMTSLMMIFLLISVIYMIQVQDMVKIPAVYSETLQGLGQALQTEFKKDLDKWDATIDEDLTVRFKEPSIMFSTGSANLTPRFKDILDDFFPRYIRIMTDPKYVKNIEEIRIEGHTSSFWRAEVTPSAAYFHNMELSQARTRSTLEYVVNSNKVSQSPDMFLWLKSHVRAIGFSSGKTVDSDGTLTGLSMKPEDPKRSQRVEFRVRTNVEKQVADIVNKSRASK